MENRDHQAVVQIIERENPDVIFLMETDETWVEALTPILDTYDTVLLQPQSKPYGLIFATTPPTIKGRMSGNSSPGQSVASI